MQWHSDSLSDTGRQRSKNEDACLDDPANGLFILADGMGGHPAGEVASSMAVTSLHRRLRQARRTPAAEIPELVKAAIAQTSREIFQAGCDNPAWRNMGTTLVMAWCHRDMAFVANVGDSRSYLLRAGRLRQCSEDHTLGNRRQLPLQDQGMLQHILTQALGLEEPVAAYQQQLALQPEDRLLLCSDGLTNMLGDTQIAAILARPLPPHQLCSDLVEAANAEGGLDNISVVVVKISA